MFGREITIAVRSLRRSPVFTGTILAILALASGALIAVFSVVHQVLLKPMPVVDQDRIVTAWKEDYRAGFAHYPFSYPSAVALAGQLTTASDFATIDYNGVWPLSLTDGDRAIRLPTGMVSGNLFPLLGVKPVIGRLFDPADDVIGGPRLVVISEALWRSHFGADPSVVGRTLAIFGISYEIIGVAPAGFDFPRRAVAWMTMFPWQGDYLRRTDAVTQDIVVRLAPGATLEQLRAELESARSRAPLEQHREFASHRVVARRFADVVVGDVRPMLLLVGAGALLVLIVASANVGGLLLVRAGEKLPEIAIRSAIGGGRSAVLRVVLLEHVLLVVAGISLGIGVAWLAIATVAATLPLELPRTTALSLDLLPVGAGSLVGLVVGIIGGLFPARALLRADLGEALRSGARGRVSGWGNHPLRRMLVSSQLALAVVAAAGAGLLIRTLDRLHRIDVGFDADELIFVELTTRIELDTSTARNRNLVDRLTERIRTIPGVESVAASFSPPFPGNAAAYGKFRAEGQGEGEIAGMPLANRESVTPGYFETAGLRMIAGRTFRPSDDEDGPPVAVINESFARRLSPGVNPIGRRIGYAGTASPDWRIVVGVVADTRFNELRAPVPTVYAPYRQIAEVPWYLTIRPRSTAHAPTVAAALGRAIPEGAPGMALVSARPMRQLLSEPLAGTRTTTGLSTVFALVAVGLAAVGVYGVLSSFVWQRTREIGLRMALGATGAEVSRLVVKQGLGVVVAGLALGFAGAIAAGRALTGLLYEVEPTDPRTMLLVATALAIVALVAMLVPAHRATRVDPGTALRAD